MPKPRRPEPSAKKRSGRRRTAHVGSGAVVLTSIRACGADGQTSFVYEHGAALTLSVGYQVNDPAARAPQLIVVFHRNGVEDVCRLFRSHVDLADPCGEIVLAVLAALLFVPSFSLPFIGLELFIGFIQAFVFAFLVLLYIILALESHGGEEHEAHEGEAHLEAVPVAA